MYAGTDASCNNYAVTLIFPALSVCSKKVSYNGTWIGWIVIGRVGLDREDADIRLVQ